MLAVVIYTLALEENDKNYFAAGNGIMWFVSSENTEL